MLLQKLFTLEIESLDEIHIIIETNSKRSFFIMKMNYLRPALGFLFIISSLFITSCRNNPDTVSNDTTMTQANVVLNLKKGETTQADVLNAFGAPNIITTDAADNEVWSYQRNGMTTQTSGDGFYATVILAGYNSSGGGFSQSTRTATLIIKFGTDKKVVDFKFMSTSF
ncbi:MAG TPA: hypothetical protein DD381_04815 [Lentisphaeria bacterium]|nr:hypothetical protein [Lentisphaeria bacterium]